VLDQLSLGKGSWHARNNVNVISHTADANEFGTEVTADCRQITMHARPHI
jgi:hypothetical protein